MASPFFANIEDSSDSEDEGQTLLRNLSKKLSTLQNAVECSYQQLVNQFTTHRAEIASIRNFLEEENVRIQKKKIKDEKERLRALKRASLNTPNGRRSVSQVLEVSKEAEGLKNIGSYKENEGSKETENSEETVVSKEMEVPTEIEASKRATPTGKKRPYRTVNAQLGLSEPAPPSRLRPTKITKPIDPPSPPQQQGRGKRGAPRKRTQVKASSGGTRLPQATQHPINSIYEDDNAPALSQIGSGQGCIIARAPPMILLPSPSIQDKLDSLPPTISTIPDGLRKFDFNYIRQRLGGRQGQCVVKVGLEAQKTQAFHCSHYLALISEHHHLPPQSPGRHGAMLDFSGVEAVDVDPDIRYPLFVRSAEQGNKWTYYGEYVVAAHEEVPVAVWKEWPEVLKRHWAMKIKDTGWGQGLMCDQKLIQDTEDAVTNVTVEDVIEFFEREPDKKMLDHLELLRMSWCVLQCVAFNQNHYNALITSECNNGDSPETVNSNGSDIPPAIKVEQVEQGLKRRRPDIGALQNESEYVSLLEDDDEDTEYELHSLRRSRRVRICKNYRDPSEDDLLQAVIEREAAAAPSVTVA